MNLLEFQAQNGEYIIQLEKIQQAISFTEYSKYKIYIRFLDSLHNKILEIESSVKEILECINTLNLFYNNFGNTYSDIIHFGTSSNLQKYFVFIQDIYSGYNIDKVYPEEEERFSFQIFQESPSGNISRLYIEFTYNFIDTITYNLFYIIEEIPNLEKIIYSQLEDYYKEYSGGDNNG